MEVGRVGVYGQARWPCVINLSPKVRASALCGEPRPEARRALLEQATIGDLHAGSCL